jgi:hypothetical protein
MVRATEAENSMKLRPKTSMKQHGPERQHKLFQLDSCWCNTYACMVLRGSLIAAMHTMHMMQDAVSYETRLHSVLNPSGVSQALERPTCCWFEHVLPCLRHSGGLLVVFAFLREAPEVYQWGPPSPDSHVSPLGRMGPLVEISLCKAPCQVCHVHTRALSCHTAAPSRKKS